MAGADMMDFSEVFIRVCLLRSGKIFLGLYGFKGAVVDVGVFC